MRILKVILITLFSILFYSCSIKDLTYRKAVKGYVCEINGTAMSNVSIMYDSLDIISPRNNKSNTKGYFCLPKIQIEETNENKKIKKELSSYILFIKEGYLTKIINIEKYEIQNKDTINLGIIYLEKKIKYHIIQEQEK